MHSCDSGECSAPPHIKYLQRPLACHTRIHRLFIEVLRAGFLLSGAITFFPSAVGRGLFLPDPPRPASLSRTCPPLPYYTCPRLPGPTWGKHPQSTGARVAKHHPTNYFWARFRMPNPPSSFFQRMLINLELAKILFQRGIIGLHSLRTRKEVQNKLHIDTQTLIDTNKIGLNASLNEFT